MAKTNAKTSAKPRAKAPAKKAPDIESAARTALAKLRELSLDAQLQADLDWGLGSYSYDKNPSGLYETVGRAIKVFNAERGTKPKGVTAKLVSHLEMGNKNSSRVWFRDSAREHLIGDARRCVSTK